MNKIAVDGNILKIKGSPINGTNDREACPKRWIAVLVQANCEKKRATTRQSKATFNKGKIVVQNAHHVDINKERSLKDVKAIVEQIKKTGMKISDEQTACCYVKETVTAEERYFVRKYMCEYPEEYERALCLMDNNTVDYLGEQLEISENCIPMNEA